jgi:hypothetical protein
MRGTEYDTFDYKHFDAPLLSLDEAEQSAARLRKTDPHSVYRVLPGEEDGFIVAKVPLAKVQAERWGAMIGRLWRWFPINRTAKV